MAPLRRDRPRTGHVADTLVRARLVVMRHELGNQMPRMYFSTNHEAGRALLTRGRTHRSANALRFGAAGPMRANATSSASNTASKPATNLLRDQELNAASGAG